MLTHWRTIREAAVRLPLLLNFYAAGASARGFSTTLMQ